MKEKSEVVKKEQDSCVKVTHSKKEYSHVARIEVVWLFLAYVAHTKFKVY